MGLVSTNMHKYNINQEGMTKRMHLNFKIVEISTVFEKIVKIFNKIVQLITYNCGKTLFRLIFWSQ